RRPSFVVGAGRQLGDVVGGAVGYHAADLAKVVDRVRGIRRAAADSQNEQAAAARAGAGQQLRQLFDYGSVQTAQDLGGFGNVLFGEAHGQCHLISHFEQAVGQDSSPAAGVHVGPGGSWRPRADL